METLTFGRSLSAVDVSMPKPSALSTWAFVGVVLGVGALWITYVNWAYSATRQRRRVVSLFAGGYVAALTLGFFLAQSGALAALAGSPAAAAYLVVSNGLALILAFSPFGARLAGNLPLAALVGIQAFRLPLELVLHAWHAQGVIPVQMTYAGDNWDIVTGVSAVLAAAAIPRLPKASARAVAAVFSAIGCVLLVRVMLIALRSIPGPLRGYEEGPLLLLPFFAPYTWIVPGCVSVALFFHIVLVRALLKPERLTRGDGAAVQSSSVR